MSDFNGAIHIYDMEDFKKMLVKYHEAQALERHIQRAHTEYWEIQKSEMLMHIEKLIDARLGG